MMRFRSHKPSYAATAHRRSRVQRARAGHTLVEILLALGLSLVILTAVYAALDQHWRYADAGQRQTERMQVTRALFERLSLDLRSVVFRPAVAGDQVSAAGAVRRINVVQPSEPYTGRSIGIIGDAETIVVQVTTPDAARSSRSRTIRWELRALEPNELDGSPTKPRGAAPAVTTDQTAFGLARVELNQFPPPASTDAKPASSNDLLAVEVESIGFRYFARGSWFEQWDSVSRQALPQAVEITIGFRRADAAEQKTSRQASEGNYRLVVPIPASEA